MTFLFTDIEGSTGLVRDLGPSAYRAVLEHHQRLLRAAFEAHGGIERGTEGDSFFVVFADAGSALAAAVEAQRALSTADWPELPDSRPVRVRMGLHTGEAIIGGDDYVGVDVNRAARIAAAAHGGQVLVSEATWALTHRSMPDGVEMRHLGEHRLRGLAEPEPIYQLVIAGLPSAFPPPRTESAMESHLPARLTSFVGRETDLERLRPLVAEHRLVTLVGPGGTGKTTLAVEYARTCAGLFPDGVWLVPLDTVRDPELVPGAIAAGLDLRDVTGTPAHQRLLENLARRTLLLVLDNFEHLAPAAALIGELLSATPVSFLVTSRSPLHLRGERVYPVDPLPVPATSMGRAGQTAEAANADPAELLAVPSVRLFVDRAVQVQPSFALTIETAPVVADICARLDGLPLAIELAAARLPLLGIVGIRDRLARQLALPAAPVVGAPERQRTLQDTIAWSHDLLDEPSRRLFAWLSVFAGGCRLPEAESICGPEAELGADVLETLGVLVDQSLIVTSAGPDDIRYDMLRTIHEFAARRLEPADRAARRRRHALTYLALAEADAPLLAHRTRTEMLERVGSEADNYRTAFRWAIEEQDAEVGLRLATALATVWGHAPWGLSSDITEGRDLVLAALALPGAEAPSPLRMRALEAAGTAYYYGGEMARATEMYQAQLATARAIEDRRGQADARFNLVFTEDWRHRLPDELAELDEIEAAYQAVADERGVARSMFPRSTALLGLGRMAEAEAVLEKAIERYQALDDVAYESMAASTLGAVAQLTGDRLGAARWLLRVIVFSYEFRANEAAATTLVLPLEAVAALDLDRPEEAAVLLGASESLSRRYGVRPPSGLASVLDTFDPSKQALDALGPAAFEAAKDRGRAMSHPEVLEMIMALARDAGIET